jgi:recombination protein RecA
MSQALRKLSGAIKQSNAAVVFTNQLRQKIGVMFGNPETTSGGMALKFYASVRLDIRLIQSIKQSGEVVGNRTRIRVKKNKVAPPFRVAEFDIMYDEGISRVGDVLDLAVEMGVIDKRGSYYSYQDNTLAQGRENTKEVLRQDLALLREVENLVREANDLPTLPPLEGGPVKEPVAVVDRADPEYAQEDEESSEADD